MRRLLGTFAVASMALVACSSGDEPKTYPASFFGRVGCEHMVRAESVRYVRNTFTCTKEDGTKTSISMFHSDKAKATYKKSVEGSGTVILQEGNSWIETKQ
jgi:hypothetical protein